MEGPGGGLEGFAGTLWCPVHGGVPFGKCLLMGLQFCTNLLMQFTKSGAPTKRWAVRAIFPDTEGATVGAPEDFEAPGGFKFEGVLRCALCSVSPPWSSYHNQVQCPYLGTLNKVRENLGIEHIKTSNNGRLVLPRTEKPTDFKAFLEQDKKWKAEMERKMGELMALLKGSQKRPAPEDSAGPSKPSKSARKEQKGKGKGKQGKESKDSKGKGKAD
ncbi:hypothetical protein BD414DRAFT_47399 [Trametes punicea]|nr:hypothetical protein BD414DRAFT_47399 [Trametes punicea]